MFLYSRKCKLGSLVDVAIAAGNFKTLVQIIVDLGVVDQFKGKTPQTVFAPSDEAFAKLPEGTLANLTMEQKARILFRHVVYDATVLAADIEIGPLKTLGGEVIDIIIEDNTGGDVIQIEYKGSLSSIVVADVMASNGVIHVIDNVILPAILTTTTTITTTAPPPTPILPGINICFPEEFDFNARGAEPIAQFNIVICGDNEVCQKLEREGELSQYG